MKEFCDFCNELKDNVETKKETYHIVSICKDCFNTGDDIWWWETLTLIP